MCVCMCVYVYIYIYIYVCIHIHIMYQSFNATEDYCNDNLSCIMSNFLNLLLILNLRIHHICSG